MANFNNFTNYNQTVSGITHDLKKLGDYSRKMKLDGNASAIDEVLKRLEENEFRVAIVGEFNHGKSTLINALLAKDVLPMNILPTTATLNKVRYNIDKFVEIRYKDGREEKIGIDQLNNYVTKITKEGEERAKTIKEAIVHYPVPYCQNGVTIIDTPGLNDDEAMTEVVMEVLPQIDAAIMVIMAQFPLSESERDFLESKLITSDLGRVMFVVTGIDQIDAEDADRVLQHIAESIQEHIVAKAKRTYGEGSEEFEKYRSKIGKVKVHGLSAKKALKAEMDNDDKMLKESCFPEFKTALECFLTEEKGAITLAVPLNRIKASSVELEKAAELRSGVLAMQKDEFKKKYTLATEEIERIRRRRNEELSRIHVAEDRVLEELAPAIKSFWPSVETAAMSAIDSVEIKKIDDIKNEKEQKKVVEKLTNAVRNAISLESEIRAENVRATIIAALGQEADKISGFEASFFQATDNVQGLFTADQAKQKKEAAKEAGIDIVKDILKGGDFLGGAIKGFKERGVKGALVDGAVKATGAIVGVGLFLAIPFAAPAVIIGALGTGLFCHFTGKWAKGKFFPGNQIVEFKNSFKKAVQEDLNLMKIEAGASKGVREQVGGAFKALTENIRSETENTLTDMQRQLDQIKDEKIKSEADCENERKALNSMLEDVEAICARANEIGEQIMEVLSK